MTRKQEELVNNNAKLSVLDEQIALENRKLETEGIDEVSWRGIAERLCELQDERASCFEAASAIRENLRSQINHVREMINRVFVVHEDKTLAERIRTLFREQGITIISIITAISMSSVRLSSCSLEAEAVPPPLQLHHSRLVREGPRNG